MTATAKNWRVHLRKGDTLRTTTTYDTKLGSWYESMGIMVVYVAENSRRGTSRSESAHRCAGTSRTIT